MGIRALASAWLLAAVGAIGVLLRTEANAAWLIAPSSLVVIVCTLAVAGLAALWVMDQLVFHRLLNAVFLVGLKMEFDDPRLPPIRAMMMMMSAEGEDMRRWERLVYLIPLLVLATVALLVTVTLPVRSSR